MSSHDLVEAAGVLIIIGLMFYLPRKFNRRQRSIAGIALFVGGWAGIFLGLALDNRSFLQSELVAYIWMGSCMAATVLAITLLVPTGLEWLKSVRPRRGKREKWPPQ